MIAKLWSFLAIGILITMLNSAGGAKLFSLLKTSPDRDCQPVKRDVLKQRLGNAYNHRYMAMDAMDLPSANENEDQANENQDYASEHVNVTKRASPINFDQIKDPSPWTCQTREAWINLGLNYFPRTVRSVTCSSNTCWFEHFRCRPKYYTIKVLKKKVGECLRVFSVEGIPEFQDFWETHEYKITVDCVCGH